MKRTITLTFLFVWLASFVHSQDRSLRHDESAADTPRFLSFDELVTLSTTAKPNSDLAARLDSLLSTPIVNNEASTAGVAPHRPTVQNLGPVVRVAQWNIERGLNFQEIRSALTNTRDFESVAGNLNQMSSARRERVESQLATLQSADILVLNEVDLGMKRTEYRDVARELAAALHMNYAYGVEFVEVDSVFGLGTEQLHLRDVAQDQRLQEDLQVDRNRYRGLHGTAILSRYPIRNPRILRLPVCYDWYTKEAKEAARIERGKRWAADKVFKERINREVRQGGRMALIAEVAIPESPTGEATIVATHLENKCAPACRRRQMAALLADLKQDENPLVIAGDFNTTGRTNTPTSVRNEIMSRVTDYQFWIKQTVSHFNPLGIYQYALFPAHYFHGYNDPTALHLPILWENKERPLFKTMERFRFADESSFDFSGDPDRALKQRGRTLSDSNERSGKGFVPTYSFARDYRGLVGRFKLDWIIVKRGAHDPQLAKNPELFAPHFPVTMRELNESVDGRIADHAPMKVDLPLGEPPSTPTNP